MASLLPSKKVNGPSRVLVTGAGGFLGSHCCRYFGEAGHEVAAVGRFHASLDLTHDCPNLAQLGGMTLPDPAFLDLVSQFKPQLLIHCAGTSSVKDSVSDPYGDFQKTVEVCAFVLEALRRKAPGCFFVLLSSASVYGNPATLPVDESCPVSPISPYGFHKVMCETLASEYGKLHGISTATLRIFSAFGENCRKQVVHDLCAKLLREPGSDVEVIGTGHATRDFIHARDVAAAADCVFKNRAPGIFNLGTGSETSVRKLYSLLTEGLGVNKKARYTGKTRPGDPIQWRADISRLRNLGFEPTVKLAEGISAYCRWFLDHERQLKMAAIA